MDGYEATRIVFSRIQNLDPENASKIMGLLLIQDHGEKEMIRLAFGPESLVHSVIVKARKELGLTSPPQTLSSSPSSPSTLFSRQSSFSSSSSSRLGFNPPSITIPNPSWSAVSELPVRDHLVSPNGNSSLNPGSMPFYGNGGGVGDGGGDLIDELQMQDQLSFLNDNTPSLAASKNPDLSFPQFESLPSPTGDSVLFPSYWNDTMHRRSCSFNDVLGSEDLNSGLGWRPCLYYARGFCKNGSNCSFVHGGLGGDSDCGSLMVGSPNSSNKMEMMEQCHELLRSKSLQHHQQRLAAASQLLSSASSFPYSPKCMNFDSPRAAAAAAALMMGDEMLKFGRARFDRNELVNPASRQIYLTFPADSTFREEDVSNYFSIYGPVQDVRIPYQQKRMFGFVTFVYPETVKIILAKGNPHFVCDARVLVKPYKEKGKVPDKKQQGDRGEFSPCGTPTGLDSRDPSDLQFGPRSFGNNQDLLWRRKVEEQADLQKAIEMQTRRLMSLQLLDAKKHYHQRNLSTGSPIPSPTYSPSLFSQSMAFHSFHNSPEVPPENCSSPLPAISLSAPPPEKQTQNASTGNNCTGNGDNGSGKEGSHDEDNDLQESLEHNLPDNLFASPTKGSIECISFANSASEAEKASITTSSANDNSETSATTPTNSSSDMASLKLNCQRPRLSSGHGAIGMLAHTTSESNYPVGI